MTALTATPLISPTFGTVFQIDAELAFFHIDARHDAKIAVVDVLVVIVLDLHDLVTRTEGPAEAFDADLARRVQRVLQLDIERASAEGPRFIGQST